ncbi:Ig-like domain-containing protein [Hyalangium minutum]|nr:Ig-like domain-containing protein [Hyalangium minutum]
MRRLLTACAFLSLAGCLDPGDPVLAVRDTDPPEVQSTEPVASGQIASDGSLEITFSEFMDVRTLRPGIAVFSGRDEVPLTITVPAPTDGSGNVEGGDIPYTVKVRATSGAFTPNASFTLVLRTILSDYEGNALTEEVRVPFRTGL